MQNKRIVIKIGTNLLTKETSSGISLDEERLEKFTGDVSKLLNAGWEVIVVTSGAVASGAGCLGSRVMPRTVPEKQAAAAVGQPLLMNVYDKCFSKYGVTVAQLLLTRADFQDRTRYVNVHNALMTLIEKKVVPVINENDTVSVEEIRFGDNDTLSALVSVRVDAQLLILLTDVEGLCTADPDRDKNAVCIREVKEITADIEKLSRQEKGLCVGTGGMRTKIDAAKIATKSGVTTYICDGRKQGVLLDIINGKSVGTKFIPTEKITDSKKKWIAFGTKPKGTITIDDGAVNALVKGGKSLLPSGIMSVSGDFSVGESVVIANGAGKEIARGIVNYSSDELQKIKKKKTSEINKILGRCD
ncbi:MAG: glutamate 5-kinase, partial [Elusimicrobiota bacterium]